MRSHYHRAFSRFTTKYNSGGFQENRWRILGGGGEGGCTLRMPPYTGQSFREFRGIFLQMLQNVILSPLQALANQRGILDPPLQMKHKNLLLATFLYEVIVIIFGCTPWILDSS